MVVAQLKQRLVTADGSCVTRRIVGLALGALIGTWLVGAVTSDALAGGWTCRDAYADVEAKDVARSAEVAAELIATEDNGSYAHVTPARIHHELPEIPVTRGQAAHAHQGAFLQAASGTVDSYRVTAITFPGHAYTIRRRPTGGIIRTVRECGRTLDW